MIADLNRYPDYRESGHEWLGRVPSHWRVMRIKTVLQEKDSRSTDGSGVLLSLTRIRGLIPRTDMTDKIHSARTLVGYKIYSPGEIVMNRMQAWSGMFGCGSTEGLISPDYAVFRIRTGDNVNVLLARLKAADMVSQFALESKGIGSGFNRLYSDRLGAIPISLPPSEEQIAIIRYLDWANARLDRMIRAKRKVIALLNEQKQAIIHRVVTCGLDSSVPLKRSGASWLGDIPAGWAVLRAKYLFCEIDERSSTGSEELLSVSHLTGVTPRSQKNITMFKAESYAGHKLCRPGDLVINTMWAWMGALGISKDTGIISPAYAVYRQRGETRLSQGFIDALLRTRLYIDEFTRRSTGIRSSRLRMYPEEFFKVEILVPPRPEQEEIVSFISTHTANLNVAIERVSGEVDLLREYRTRLIADVVTGKLDVREAAMRLPVEETPMEEDLFSDGEIPDDEVMEQEG